MNKKIINSKTNIKMSNIMIREAKGESTYFINYLNSYEDFDLIIRFLRDVFSIEIIKNINGPDMRICEFTISNIPFTLYHDYYGNELSCSIEWKETLKAIAKNLSENFSS